MFSQEIIRIFFLKQWISLLNSLSHTEKARDTFFRFDCCESSEKLGLGDLVHRNQYLEFPFCYYLYICAFSPKLMDSLCSNTCTGILQLPWQKMYIYYIVTELTELHLLLPSHTGEDNRPVLPSTFLTQRWGFVNKPSPVF